MKPDIKSAKHNKKFNVLSPFARVNFIIAALLNKTQRGLLTCSSFYQNIFACICFVQYVQIKLHEVTTSFLIKLIRRRLAGEPQIQWERNKENQFEVAVLFHNAGGAHEWLSVRQNYIHPQTSACNLWKWKRHSLIDDAVHLCMWIHPLSKVTISIWRAKPVELTIRRPV